jgi:hypothetical protein
VIANYDSSYPLQIFRYLHLPSSLTDKLSVEPNHHPDELEPV